MFRKANIHLLISMPSKSLIKSALQFSCLVLIAVSPTHVFAATSGSLLTTVKHLGRDDHDLARIQLLAEHPSEAVRLLVNELQPVTDAHVPGNEQFQLRYRSTMHVIWCIHALRYLTNGLDFTATTTYTFGTSPLEQERQSLLHESTDHEVRFLGVWMSRDSTFVAPLDAQEKIIAAWQEWAKNNTSTFKFVSPGKKLPPEVWYF